MMLEEGGKKYIKRHRIGSLQTEDKKMVLVKVCRIQFKDKGEQKRIATEGREDGRKEDEQKYGKTNKNT